MSIIQNLLIQIVDRRLLAHQRCKFTIIQHENKIFSTIHTDSLNYFHPHPFLQFLFPIPLKALMAL